MKIRTKQEGKHTWIALQDNDGFYHCPMCKIGTCSCSKNIILAGSLQLKKDIPGWRKMLQEEGHQ